MPVHTIEGVDALPVSALQQRPGTSSAMGVNSTAFSEVARTLQGVVGRNPAIIASCVSSSEDLLCSAFVGSINRYDIAQPSLSLFPPTPRRPRVLKTTAQVSGAFVSAGASNAFAGASNA